MNDILEFEANLDPNSIDLPMTVIVTDVALPMGISLKTEIVNYDDTELRSRIGVLEDGITEARTFIEQLVDYSAPVISDGIRPERFGAKGDGVTDDTIAIQSAIDSGKCVIFGTSKVYLVSSPLRLRDGMSLIGANKNQRTWGHTVIKNEKTDLFDYNFESGSTVIDNVTISGISFRGNESQNHIVFRPGMSNSHNWVISHCGFDGWDSIFPYDSGLVLTHWYMHDIACSKVNSIGRINGADNTLYRWNAGDFSNVDREYLIRICTTISRYENMFFTAKLKGLHGADNIMRIDGSSAKGNVIKSCWFDYCDKSAIVIDNRASENVVTGCSFRGVGRKSESSNRIQGIRILSDCNRNLITSCAFLKVHTGDEVPDSSSRFYIANGSNGNVVTNNMYEVPLQYAMPSMSAAANTVQEPSENVMFGGSMNWRTSSHAINFAANPRTVPAYSELIVNVGDAAYSAQMCAAHLQKEFAPLPSGVSIARAYIDGGKLNIVFYNNTESNIVINDERKIFSVNYAFVS